MSTTPAADLIYKSRENGVKWGYDPELNLFLSGSGAPAPTREQEEVFFRYWVGVKLLLQLEMVTQKPKTITIEHDKRCQLACGYCYAGSNVATTSPRLDPARMYAFAERYQVKDFYIYGGDAFFDPAYVVGMMEEVASRVGQLDRIYISTNALGMTPYWLQRLQACTKNVDIQISTEPEFFAVRNTKAGPHQMTVLRDKIKALPKDFRIKYTVVLSDEAPVKDRPFMDSVNELREVADGRKFNIRWAMVEDNVKIDEPLPWMERWVYENWEGSTKNKDPELNGAFFGSSVLQNLQRWTRTKEHPELFGALVACGAGTSNFAFHYDGNVYTCHGKAVDGYKDHIIKDELGAWARWQKSRPMMAPSFVHESCRTCPARQLCVLCIQRIYPINCWFERERQAHGIYMMHQYDRQAYDKLAEFTKAGYDRIMGRFDELKALVHSPAWDRFVHGTDAIGDAQHCYQAAFGKEMAPLFEVVT